MQVQGCDALHTQAAAQGTCGPYGAACPKRQATFHAPNFMRESNPTRQFFATPSPPRGSALQCPEMLEAWLMSCGWRPSRQTPGPPEPRPGRCAGTALRIAPQRPKRGGTMEAACAALQEHSHRRIWHYQHSPMTALRLIAHHLRLGSVLAPHGIGPQARLVWRASKQREVPHQPSTRLARGYSYGKWGKRAELEKLLFEGPKARGPGSRSSSRCRSGGHLYENGYSPRAGARRCAPSPPYIRCIVGLLPA
mmetsp:Transcript_87313/g.208865  ORF Transcript_87313/g.208865 Transcript_87313/m.208865 type:complete len:251 (-) Transcript_87313:381-1133(-)